MVYDYSFDGKSLGALFACSAVLCVLLFFAGVLVGTGWSAKATTNADAQPALQPAPAQSDTAQPIPAQPASVASLPRATSALPQEPVLYDDPVRQEYAAQGYGAQGYNARGYEQQGYGAQAPERQSYGPRGYAAQGTQAGVQPQPTEQRAAPSFNGRREADRLSALSIDPDPRVVEEADVPASAQPSGTPNYSVQVGGAYLDEREARRLAGELENKGYTPTVFSGTDAEARVWYAVRIGAYASVKDAGQAANNFARQERMKAAVRPAGSL
ncbi:MAG TPA: SPOR domain-containing protein [Pyrinomonadaceae bacterium]|nr:SPOR domain-containing protein [Pyrinomonadaceae bacterium]